MKKFLLLTLLSAGCELLFPSEHCGNAIFQENVEECDDGNRQSGDGCNKECKLEGDASVLCGDAAVNTKDEECDDGNTTSGDGCSEECLSELPVCGDGREDHVDFNGDGINDVDEECDDGDLNSDDTPDACRSNCVLASCGDEVTDAGEGCDDGDLNSDDTPNACRSNCEEAGCGDNIIDDGEECDDGNQTDGDGCQATCLLPNCGDGVVDIGEECDDGNDPNNDSCQDTCRLPVCGDGIVDVSKNEQCDDGSQCEDGTVCESSDDCLGVGFETCAPRDGDQCSASCALDVFVSCRNAANNQGNPDALQLAINAADESIETNIFLEDNTICNQITINGENINIIIDNFIDPVAFPKIKSNNINIPAVTINSGRLFLFGLQVEGGTNASAIVVNNTTADTTDSTILGVLGGLVFKTPSSQDVSVIDIQNNSFVAIISSFVTSNIESIGNASVFPQGADLGLSCSGNSPTVLIDQSTFIENLGGGINTEDTCKLIASNSQIISNGSDFNISFGAFQAIESSSISIVHSTIVDNFVNFGSGKSSTMNCTGSSTCKIDSSILTGRLIGRNDTQPIGADLVQFSNILPSNFQSFDANPNDDSNRNIAINPGFVSNDDLHLSPDSACINLGNPILNVNILPFDPIAIFGIDIKGFDASGVPRPLVGGPDMGAFESTF